MRALDKKLLRDLVAIRGQAAAIALVIACGVSILVVYLANHASLERSRQVYYERSRMADVFAGAKRAPLSLVRRVAAIPGVARVEARVVADVVLEVPGLADPAAGRLVSIPEHDVDTLNDLFLRRGRYPEPGRADEVVASEAFALANRLRPGDSVGAILNGRRRQLEIVGIGLSPEFVYAVRPGDLLPDDRRFGVLWMGRPGLAAAFQMEGAFNDVVLRLAPGAAEQAVIDRLDDLLRPYGGLGAIPRRLQTSDWFVANELMQLETMGVVIPAIFLGVAVFLLAIVLGRIVAVQREQIAALKALGYSNREVGRHYARLALLVGMAGGVLGVAVGAWLGRELLELYNEFFRFPVLAYRLPPALVAGGLAASAAGAWLGAAGAVRRAAALPPAEAMRPAAPGLYRRTVVERLGLGRRLSPAARMVLRNLERHPLRTGLSCLGVALAAALMVAGVFMFDAIDRAMEELFSSAQRQDVTVALVEPRGAAAVHELARLPGVLAVEEFGAVPVRLVHGHRSRRASVLGLAAEPELHRVAGRGGRPVPLPPRGLAMTTTLAEVLGVGAGDEVVVEVLTGRRPVRSVRVARLVDEPLGTNVYMDLGALRRLTGEGDTVSGAFLRADPGEARRLHAALLARPLVAAVALRRAAIEGFEKNVSEYLGVVLAFNLVFGGVIAFGVVYNGARVSLSERSRDLGSLRVLGFTRREIAAVLLGEIAALTAVGIPLGLVLGRGLAALMVAVFSSELMRIPLVVFPRTYALAAVTVTVATVVSALVVRRRLDRLDLVAVLKTRD
ncbi:MAG TPA: ABC transporter permease [Thermoanaerobaculia bacterium]